jgi:hypothetical protein
VTPGPSLAGLAYCRDYDFDSTLEHDREGFRRQRTMLRLEANALPTPNILAFIWDIEGLGFYLGKKHLQENLHLPGIAQRKKEQNRERLLLLERVDLQD